MIGRIAAVVRKDLKAFARDRFYMLITILGLVFYVVIFWLLPDTVDETIELGVHQTGLEAFFDQFAGDEGVTLVRYDTAAALESAVEAGDEVTIGISFPDDFVARVAAGTETTVRVLVAGEVPEQLRDAVSGLVRELAYAAAGEQPLVSEPQEEQIILGQDRAGDQVSLRERFRPLFAFAVLLVETIALASLVATEIQTRTVTAVLATPMRIGEFLAAKGVLGTLLAFTESMLLLAALASLRSFGLVLVMLLGSVLVTGFGLLAGSSGRDFIGIVFWSMLFLIPLAIPVVGLLFPGTASAWVQALPSYGLVQAILRATAYGEGLGAYLPHVVSLAAWCVAVFGAGWLVLRRRLEAV